MSALWHPTNCEKLQKIKIPKIDLLIFFLLFNHFCKHPISYFTQLCFIKRSLASYCKEKKSRKSFFFSLSKSKRQKVMIDLLLPSKLSWNGLSAWNTCDWFSKATRMSSKIEQKDFEKYQYKTCTLLPNELIFLKNTKVCYPWNRRTAQKFKQDP